MYTRQISTSGPSAAQARRRLLQLEAERAEAREAGVLKVAAFRADIEEEITLTREAYVGLAVTEIAMLRADLSGRGRG